MYYYQIFKINMIKMLSTISFFLLVSTQLSSSILGKQQEIHVDFYPGSAKVIVIGIPEATTMTPGILKLSTGELDAPDETDDSYVIRFIKDDFQSENVIIRSEPKSIALNAFLCFTCFPLHLCFSSTGYTRKLEPNTIFAIDKNAAQTLGKIEPLIFALKSEITWVRADAAEALGNIGDKDSVEPLIITLNDKKPDVRAKSAEALGKIGDLQAVEPLIATLKDKNLDVWNNAIFALGKMKSTQTIKLLSELLKDKHLKVRKGAVLALGLIQDTCAVEPLIIALKDTDESVQCAAIDGLMNIDDNRYLEPLIDIIKTSNSINVLLNTSECLRKIEGNKSKLLHIKYLEEKDVSIKARIAFVLGEMGTVAKDAIPSLIQSIPFIKFEAVKISYCDISQIKYLDISSKNVLTEYSILRSQPHIQQKIMEEKIKSRATGGTGYSSTELNLIPEAIGRSIGDAIATSIIKDFHYAKELLKIEKKAENMQTDELQTQFGIEYIKINSVEATTKRQSIKIVAEFTFFSSTYALSKITGQDFGNDQKKWSEWWEKNKEKF